MDFITTEDVRALINSLSAINEHKNLINASVAYIVVEALHKLEALESAVLYAEYKKDCVAEEGS